MWTSDNNKKALFEALKEGRLAFTLFAMTQIPARRQTSRKPLSDIEFSLGSIYWFHHTHRNVSYRLPRSEITTIHTAVTCEWDPSHRIFFSTLSLHLHTFFPSFPWVIMDEALRLDRYCSLAFSLSLSLLSSLFLCHCRSHFSFTRITGEKRNTCMPRRTVFCSLCFLCFQDRKKDIRAPPNS